MKATSVLTVLLELIYFMTNTTSSRAMAGIAEPLKREPEIRCEFDKPYADLAKDECRLIRVKCAGFNPCERRRPENASSCDPKKSFYLYSDDLWVKSLDMDIVDLEGNKIKSAEKRPEGKYQYINLVDHSVRSRNGMIFPEGIARFKTLLRCAGAPVQNCGSAELRSKAVQNALALIKRQYSGKFPLHYTFALNGFLTRPSDLWPRIQVGDCHSCQKSTHPPSVLKTIVNPAVKGVVFCLYKDVMCRPSANPAAPLAASTVACAASTEGSANLKANCPEPTVCANDPHVSVQKAEILFQRDGSSPGKAPTSIKIQ